jgi:hypothetical protein
VKNLTEIKTKLITDTEVWSSHLALKLEGGEEHHCYLTIVDKERDIELCFVEISEEFFWTMKQGEKLELGDPST